MVDHVDILKDGASAVYGSDAVAGVVNFFLIHKFRGSGDRSDIREHKHGRLQRDGRVGGMDQSGHRR